MHKIKIIWTNILGSISSIIPMFFTVCKSGVCTVACVSPIASLLGISSAGLMASPITQSLYPLLLVICAVSFTVSYYKIYILPKYTATTCANDCDCEPAKKSSQQKFAVWTFWIGLMASVFFFSYFEYQNYKTNSSAKAVIKTEQNSRAIISSDSTEEEEPCCGEGEVCEPKNTESKP
jgi:hypothetical protein